MLVDVGERLGDDVVGGDLDVLGEPFLGDGPQIDRHRRAQCESIQRSCEPAFRENRRMQVRRQIADLLEPAESSSIARSRSGSVSDCEYGAARG